RASHRLGGGSRSPGSILPELPGASARANRYLRFDAQGDPEMAEGLDQTQTLSRSIIGQYLNPQTAAEVAAGATPVNFWALAQPIDVSRYGIVPNDPAAATDNTTALKTLLNPDAVGPRGLLFFPNTT